MFDAMAKILLIDDEPALLDVYSAMLAKAGHQVLLASSAREGLAAFSRHCPEVVITDVILPDESGLNLVLELTRPKTAAVIVVSGTDTVGGRDLLSFTTLLGARRALRKPVRRADLIDAIDDVLGQRRRREDDGDPSSRFRRLA